MSQRQVNVVRGNPTTEEIEALETAIAVLLARGAGGPATPRAGRPRLLRRPPVASQAGWRTSTWSG
ncbi:acyl-CoA carboxylase subunit epsilon [Planomonospora corallina]|uniref:Acyl-CoA carboxylase subunit epsilon n=1 Tax=Planomonospora corallina TaxID=1806052 RepID=A0ABV8I453_9ACTN